MSRYDEYGRTDLYVERQIEAGWALSNPRYVDCVHLYTTLDECVRIDDSTDARGVLAQLIEHGYDQVPVANPNGSVGWRLLATQELKLRNGIVDDQAEFLAGDLVVFESIFVEVNELLKCFIERTAFLGITPAPDRPDLRGGIYGLLTIADLNKPALRKTLFELLFDLETKLTRLIDQEFPIHEDWLRLLNEDARAQLYGQWYVLKEAGMDVSPTVGMTLGQAFQIVERSPTLLRFLGYQSGNSFKDRNGGIVKLRHRVMHPVRPLVLSQGEVSKTARAVQSASALLERFERGEEQSA